jgi:hypothetical protein
MTFLTNQEMTAAVECSGYDFKFVFGKSSYSASTADQFYPEPYDAFRVDIPDNKD